MFKTVAKRLYNLPGWHTGRKIVVLDSDDWGSIGLPSRETLDRIQNAGFNLKLNPYLEYDALASEDDLNSLFDVLRRHKDVNGNHPVFTANTVVANPDFERIEKSGFKEYHYEYFTESLTRYPKHSFDLWAQGMKEGLFFPQFHAREHLNIAFWMKALQEGHSQILFGFKNRFYILDKPTHPAIEHSCTSAHYPKSYEEFILIREALEDGLNVFENIFGFRSKSFTGTGYIWNSDFEAVLSDGGVKYLKGLLVQMNPDYRTGNLGKKYHYTGQVNKHGQVHLVRNAFFEPGLTRDNSHTVEDCLSRIRFAFNSRKPAIVSTHRINYIGFIDEGFRKTNLELLDLLLKKVIAEFPEVEFMTTDELGALIEKI